MDEESNHWEEIMCAQMETLTGVQEHGEKAALKLEHDRNVKVMKVREEDDIQA